MANKVKSTQDIFNAFMQGVHFLTTKDYWLEQRELGRVDKIAQMEIEIDSEFDPPRVSFSGYTLEERELDAVAPYLRKFVLGNEATSFRNLIPALEKEFPTHPHLPELKHQWNQISARDWIFLVSNNRTIGISKVHDGDSLLWGDPEGEIETFRISMLDTLEVYLYEGRLHAFERGRNEQMRSRIRIIEPQLLQQFQHIPFAATIFMLSIAHRILTENWSDAEKYCDDRCFEKKRIRQIMEENQK
ncbi:hypothetical protein [Rothia sp. (in: high G+C Gram-positive bacteria)]|uniref:hypothetical protein n=1 Tax=Rothia sp. (in: high G+C Gram-positive bacteria) TaxID=1885016 RepID=UPI0032169196